MASTAIKPGTLMSYSYSDITVGYSPGIDVAIGVGIAGADLEISGDSALGGGVISVSASALGLITTLELGGGSEAIQISVNGGIGTILGLGPNAEHVTGSRITIGYDFTTGWYWDSQWISETSVGAPGYGTVTVAAAKGTSPSEKADPNLPVGPSLEDRALSNSDGSEAEYIRTERTGKPQEIANAAMAIPNVLDDRILRIAAGYEDSDGDGGYRDPRDLDGDGYVDGLERLASDLANTGSGSQGSNNSPGPVDPGETANSSGARANSQYVRSTNDDSDITPSQRMGQNRTETETENTPRTGSNSNIRRSLPQALSGCLGLRCVVPYSAAHRPTAWEGA